MGVACARYKNADLESSDPGSECEDGPVKSKPVKAKKGRGGNQKKKKKEKTPKQKKKETKPSPKAKKGDAAANDGAGPGAYKAGSFSEARLKFVRATMASNGIRFREASKLWDASTERANLLAGMSRSELLRRKFIPPLKTGSTAKGGA